MISRKSYEFDRFQVDPVARILRRKGKPSSILPKSLSALILLIERAGRVVSRDELIRDLWPTATVTGASLTQTIFWLRKTLGTSAERGRFIVTVPGEGYCFAVPVRTIITAEPESPPAPLPAGLQDRLLNSPESSGSPAEPRGGSDQPSPAAPGRPILAVLDLRNLSGRKEFAWLAPALTELLTTELSAGTGLRIIPGDLVRSALASPGRQEGGIPRSARMDRLRALLAVEQIVTGSFEVYGERSGQMLRVSIRVIETSGGEVLARTLAEGGETDLARIASSAGASLRRELSLSYQLPPSSKPHETGFPVEPAAARLFAEGIDAINHFDALRAVELLGKAAEKDPVSPLIRSSLSKCWSSLGHDGRAAEEARKAYEGSANLARERRLLIEGRYREVSGEWERAAEVYRSLFTLFPDNTDYGLLLSASLTRSGNARAALEVTSFLRGLPGRLGQDPRIDMEEASAAYALAEHARSREAAARVVEKGDREGAEVMAAAGLVLEAMALRAMGERAQALFLLERARIIHAAVGDRGAVAEALSLAGLIAREQGDLSRAGELYDEGLATLREIGNRSATATVLVNIGVLRIYRGELAAAEEALEEARSIWTETATPAGMASMLAVLAALMILRCEFGRARRAAEELLAIGRQTRNLSFQASGLLKIGWILAEQGELAQACATLDEALTIANDPGDSGRVARIGAMRAGIDFRRGDVEAGRRRALDALEAKRALSDPLGVARIIDALVPIFCEKGDLEKAMTLAEEQLAIARSSGSLLIEAAASQNIGVLHLAAGRLSLARTSLERALAARIEQGVPAAVVALCHDLARLASAEGDMRGVAEMVRKAGDTAHPLHLHDAHAASQVVLAEALLDAGRVDDAEMAASQASALVEQSEDEILRLRVAAITSRVAGVGKRDPSAAADLEDISARASAMGLLRLEVSARCALGEMRMAFDAASARDVLLKARSVASAAGLAHLAGRCDRVLTGRLSPAPKNPGSDEPRQS